MPMMVVPWRSVELQKIYHLSNPAVKRVIVVVALRKRCGARPHRFVAVRKSPRTLVVMKIPKNFTSAMATIS
jgi:hypothetical protein